MFEYVGMKITCQKIHPHKLIKTICFSQNPNIMGARIMAKFLPANDFINNGNLLLLVDIFMMFTLKAAKSSFYG